MQTDRLVITSAYKLSEEEKTEIVKSLGLESTKTEIENIVKEKIIGGLIVKFGDYYFDFSIESQLKAVTASLDI